MACIVLLAGDAHGEDRDAARRHLKAGVTLYNERNYDAALVEFEASYRELPTSSALQNIALCQTKLFRYVEAIATLEALQGRFGSSLSKREAELVAEARRRLSQQVGTVSFRITPADAVAKIDGRLHPPDELSAPHRLSSGQHQLEVSAPGYVPVRRAVTIAGGEDKTITIHLVPAVGTLTINVDDEEAAIALDQVPLAYGTWTGQVLAGEHQLQIYKPGHATFSTRISIKTGDRLKLHLPVGPDVEGGRPAPGYDLVGLPYRHGKKIRNPLDPDVGWYGLVAASTFAILRSPDAFEADDDADVVGAAFGLRAGYRFGGNLAWEGLFDAGAQSVSGEYRGAAATYDLTTRRFGGNVRVLLGGRNIRLSGTFGVGAVWHRLDLAGRGYSGLNSYFGLEVGPQLNVGQVLLEGVVQAFLEGANNVKDGDARIYTERTVLPQVGVGLRVGLSQWGTW